MCLGTDESGIGALGRSGGHMDAHFVHKASKIEKSPLDISWTDHVVISLTDT
jgi:hypothetical protein